MRRLLVVLLVLIAALGAAAAGANADVIWLEAEHFRDTGSWSNDPQFVDVMGSPYLLATGLGRPVRDAITTARVEKAGDRRLWVRCKDWFPSHSPGRFEVIVNGKTSKAEFGKAADDRWHWVDGGTFALKPGDVEVRIRDLTGWWGRCDAVALSREADFRPADDLKELARQREAFGGIPADVADKQYDIVVVGGGLAGSAAAVAAARLGARVALVQDRPVLGGNASVEIGVPPEGDKTNEPLDPRETGIIEEFEPPSGKMGDWSSSIEAVVRKQPNLDLMLNTRALGLTMKSKEQIGAVEALDVVSGARTRLAGRLFIDCTGDGWLGFWAGAEYRQGRESREEFGESLAPAEADLHTMGNTLYGMNFKTHDQPVEWWAPEWAYQWDSPDDFQNDPTGAFRSMGERPASFDDFRKSPGREPLKAGGGHREWWVEHGGMSDTIQDAEAIRDDLFRINLGLWDYAKNHSTKFKAENRNKELVWLNYVPGKRESRRLVGDYIMTQRDYADQTVHPDSVAYGGWSIDDHHPWGFFSYGNEYFSAYPDRKVSIPYRCLYSKNISNLMMAGRDISVSHVALGGVRVMRTCCIMGQAAGTAAAIALARKTTPRGVYESHIDDLQQQLLKDGCYVMERSNRDPKDLARGAKVTASSVAKIPNPKRAGKLPNGGVVHDLTTNRAVMFTADVERLESVALFLRSDKAAPVEIKATLYAAPQFGEFKSEQGIAEAKAVVAPKSAGWVEFPIQAKLEPGKAYFVALPTASGLKWDLYPYEPKGTTRAYGGPNWLKQYGCYKFRLSPGGEPPAPTGSVDEPDAIALGPANVIDGWNRAVAGLPNSWGPDPAQPLPQWIELGFERPVELNRIHVTFQLPSMAARAYRIEAKQGDGWKTIHEEVDNTARRRVHAVASVTTDRVRLVLGRPGADGASPRVCEIRVYKAD